MKAQCFQTVGLLCGQVPGARPETCSADRRDFGLDRPDFRDPAGRIGMLRIVNVRQALVYVEMVGGISHRPARRLATTSFATLACGAA